MAETPPSISVANPVKRCRKSIDKYGAPFGLTDLEVDVIRLIAVGCGQQFAADELGMAYKTLNHHTRSIFSKLKIRRIEAAITIAAQHNLLKDLDVAFYNVKNTSGVALRDGRQPPTAQAKPRAQTWIPLPLPTPHAP